MAVISKDVATILALTMLGLVVVAGLTIFYMIYRLKKGRTTNNDQSIAQNSNQAFIELSKAISGLSSSNVANQSALCEHTGKMNEAIVEITRVMVELRTASNSEHKQNIENHERIARALEALHTSSASIERVVENMTNNVDDVKKALDIKFDELKKLITDIVVIISPEEKRDIIDSVSRNVSEAIISNLAEHNDILLKMFRDELGKLSIKQSETKEKEKKNEL